jgi:ATP:cob(I)alamin adenosyltransferase
MKTITTKTGDFGQTSIRGGVRVDKDDIRIETNGQIDHLTTILGMIKVKWDRPEADMTLIADIQRELMTVMSHVATPDDAENPRKLHVEELAIRMEQAIAAANVKPCFILPGETELTTWIHLARTTARTAERRLWTLNRSHPINQEILRFFNRLSDYLFVLAEDNNRTTN